MRNTVKSILTIILSLMMQAGFSQEKIQLDKWLYSGTLQLHKPVFDTMENLKGKQFGYDELLKFEYVEINKLNPVEQETFNWSGTGMYKWGQLKMNKSNWLNIPPNRNYQNMLTYLATYIEADRFMELKLKASSSAMYELYVNGEKELSQYSFKEEPDTASAKLTLVKGKHLIIVKTLKTANSKTEWNFSAFLETGDPFTHNDLRVSLSPMQHMDIDHLLNGTRISKVSLSADGSMSLISYKKTTPPEGNTETWTEIREVKSGILRQIFRSGDVGSFHWAPFGKLLSYTIKKEKRHGIHVLDLASGEERIILDPVDDLRGYRWSPEGSYLLYFIQEEAEKEKKGIKRFEGMADRWPWWRKRSFIYSVDVKSGVKQRLTHGNHSTDLHDISPDGRYFIFSTSQPDYQNRPYSRQYVMQMDLSDFSVDTLWNSNWSASVDYSPDGTQLLVQGGPELFGKKGNVVPEDMIVNNYDGQAYLYNLKTAQVEALTENFDPAVNSARWDKQEEVIYFKATDETYRRLYRYDIDGDEFREIKTGVDVLDDLSFAETAPLCLYTGSSISTPQKAYLLDLEEEENRLYADPLAQFFSDVQFGKTDEWDFENDKGDVIDGRVYYPPDFDKGKDYPLIVYYYGGTSPTERNFGGRYPKNLFASMGYVVYVLQPSGATGYGQKFSSYHVNDWGKRAGEDIIQGTKKFLADHDFINKDKIGCIGASYGGFMTMYLQTQTDLFASAISHAGISSLSSYWGEGYWGYLYSAVASANSFPWNNKELYVEHSPLFNADKIDTPMLLLHGGSDNNVPPGESIQLFTALKLLGTPVELIEIEGQGHHILDYEKRMLWQKTILAWFDKWLKDQPQWWGELYPDRNL